MKKENDASFESFTDYSQELTNLFNLDQADRQSGFDSGVIERDSVRLERARDIYKKYIDGTVTLNSSDLYHLAFLFQHSPLRKTVQNEISEFEYEINDDYKIAFELAKESTDQGNEEAKWLAAAAEDRYLLTQNKKQKWGTQFIKDGGTWKHNPAVEDDSVSGITDEIRIENNVPIRNQQLNTITEKNKNRF